MKKRKCRECRKILDSQHRFFCNETCQKKFLEHYEPDAPLPDWFFAEDLTNLAPTANWKDEEMDIPEITAHPLCQECPEDCTVICSPDTNFETVEIICKKTNPALFQVPLCHECFAPLKYSSMFFCGEECKKKYTGRKFAWMEEQHEKIKSLIKPPAFMIEVGSEEKRHD